MKKLQTVLVAILIIMGFIGLFVGVEFLSVLPLIVGGFMGISTQRGGINNIYTIIFSSLMLLINITIPDPSWIDVSAWALMILAFWND